MVVFKKQICILLKIYVVFALQKFDFCSNQKSDKSVCVE